MTKNPNFNDKIFKVQMLVYRADMNLYLCNYIYKYFSDKKESVPNLWLLIANNAFNETISILHTLLSSTIMNELRIGPILDQIVSNYWEFDRKFDDEFLSKYIEAIGSIYPWGRDMYPAILVTKKDEMGYGANIWGIIADINKEVTYLHWKTSLTKIKKEFERGHFHLIRHQSVAHKNQHITDPSQQLYSPIYPDIRSSLTDIMKDLRINSSFWLGWELYNLQCQIIYTDITKILN